MVMLSSCVCIFCLFIGYSSVVSINGRESEFLIYIIVCWNNLFILNVMYK